MGTKKSCDRNRMYMCTGENFKHNAPIGDCGDVRSLMDWLRRFYPRMDDEEINRFFDDTYTNKDVCDYVYGSVGKRLEVSHEQRTKANKEHSYTGITSNRRDLIL